MIADLGPHRIEGWEKGSLFIGPTERLQWKEWVIRTKLLRFEFHGVLGSFLVSPVSPSIGICHPFLNRPRVPYLFLFINRSIIAGSINTASSISTAVTLKRLN